MRGGMEGAGQAETAKLFAQPDEAMVENAALARRHAGIGLICG